MATRHGSQTFIIKVTISQSIQFPHQVSGHLIGSLSSLSWNKETCDEGKTEQQRGLSLPYSIIASAASRCWRVRFQRLTWMEGEAQGDTQQYPVVFHTYNSMGLAEKVSQSLFGEDVRVDSLRRAPRSWGKLTAGWYARTYKCLKAQMLRTARNSNSPRCPSTSMLLPCRAPEGTVQRTQVYDWLTNWLCVNTGVAY